MLHLVMNNPEVVDSALEWILVYAIVGTLLFVIVYIFINHDKFWVKGGQRLYVIFSYRRIHHAGIWVGYSFYSVFCNNIYHLIHFHRWQLFQLKQQGVLTALLTFCLQTYLKKVLTIKCYLDYNKYIKK